ncbi:uncharacterized protein [Macrobrachium rosenbergii]|uniref:uncharacterized protein n=1 Tax=Macrobrachium rosenbergii TaxID=79674 RepID=UPI0034D651E1
MLSTAENCLQTFFVQTQPWTTLLPFIMFCLPFFVPAVESIECYECVHNNQRVKRHNRFVYPCSEFDASPRYIMHCPDSKLCIYQRITLQLSSENVMVTTMDGCTPNTTDHARYAEAGLVKEGCIQHKSAYKPPSSEYCYCSYNLCNKVLSNHQVSNLLLLAVCVFTILYTNNYRMLS